MSPDERARLVAIVRSTLDLAGRCLSADNLGGVQANALYVAALCAEIDPALADPEPVVIAPRTPPRKRAQRPPCGAPATGSFPCERRRGHTGDHACPQALADWRRQRT